MKILQISKYYYPFIGGVEQVAYDCSAALKDEHEVKVFCFNHEKGDKNDSVDGVDVIRTGCFAKIASQSISASYYKLLKKTFKEFEPDIVIFHYPNPFASHYLLKVLKKYPKCKLYIYWHLDIYKQKILKQLFRGQNKRLCNKAVKIFATSPNYIYDSEYLHKFSEKCNVLPCCVRSEMMTVSEEERSTAQKIKDECGDKKICLAVGRHVEYKGIEYLIEASKYLDENYKIYIIGDGPLSEVLKKKANGDKKVEFLGKVDTDTLKSYLYACDIFCFPSITKNEAFGIALAEAMSFGKPAVTFTIKGSGVNYVCVDEETGLEVENKNAEKYAAAIKTLGEDEDLRAKYGKAAKERVINNFTFDKFKENLKKYLSE